MLQAKKEARMGIKLFISNTNCTLTHTHKLTFTKLTILASFHFTITVTCSVLLTLCIGGKNYLFQGLISYLTEHNLT